MVSRKNYYDTSHYQVRSPQGEDDEIEIPKGEAVLRGEEFATKALELVRELLQDTGEETADYKITYEPVEIWGTTAIVRYEAEYSA
jgi:hypothetical protein